MAKQDIIDYVMNSPANTNKMVLEGMLGDTDGVKLPEISEEDEGKVLTVIDGKWDKGIAIGGGTEPLIVDVVPIEGSEDAYLDTTWQELYDAMSQNKICYARFKSPTNVVYQPILTVINDGIYHVYILTVNGLDASSQMFCAETPSARPSLAGCEIH